MTIRLRDVVLGVPLLLLGWVAVLAFHALLLPFVQK